MKYGLIGEKLTHSFSKEIHTLINEYSYELKEISKENLKDYITSKEFKGINVTIPYKEEVIPFLDQVDEHAQKIGAVNTIVNDNGFLKGYNTDFYGLKASIEKENIVVKGKKTLVLGTGGTSKTAREVLNEMGALNIVTVSRTKKEGTVTYDEAVKLHSDAKVIVNTTPVGMYPETENSPLSLSEFKNLEGVIDVIYNPLRSELVIEAEKMGVKASGGLYMLCAQAVCSAELFLNKKLNNSLTNDIYNTLIKEKENIVLIGMPGSGKSTIGNEVLTKIFYDTDEEIEKIIGTSIKEYLENNGEDKFRELEEKVIKDLSLKNSLVIATGGGAILKEKNVKRLKRNGRLFFLDAPLERLCATSSRPLSDTKEKLENLYNQRINIYNSVCDVKIDASKSVEETLNNLKEWL